LSSIALALAFMIVPNNYNNAIAQPGYPNRPNSMGMSSGVQNQNQKEKHFISI
jgi:hypothetical protein